MNNKCIECNSNIGKTSKRCKPCSNRVICKLHSGRNNIGWKGENASYKTKHQKINKYYGKAHRCENIKCSEKSKFYEWANISGKYKRSREDWIMLCHSCNIKMDYARRHGNKCKRGHEYTEKNTRIDKFDKRHCRECERERSLEWRKKYPGYHKNR